MNSEIILLIILILLVYTLYYTYFNSYGLFLFIVLILASGLYVYRFTDETINIYGDKIGNITNKITRMFAD
jgi:hypothetical protein